MRGRRARVRDLVRRRRRDRQSDDRGGRLEGRSRRWRGRVQALAAERPMRPRSTLPGRSSRRCRSARRPLLLPAFEASGGRQGRLSMQTDPTLFRSFDRMLAQGEHFASLAPTSSSSSRPPRSASGSWRKRPTAASTSTRRCRSAWPRRVAAGEAVERGLRRREAEGLRGRRHGPGDHGDDGPARGLAAGPDRARRDRRRPDGHCPWSGVAVFKRTVAEFRARGLRARPLGAAIRHHLHWSELIGGDVVITMPAAWQRRFNASDDRGPAADGRPGRSGDPRRAARPASRTSCAPTSPTGWRPTSSMPSDRAPGRSARSSGRTTSCSTRSPTRWSRTPTSQRLT